MKRQIASFSAVTLTLLLIGCTTTSEVHPLTQRTTLDAQTPQGIAFSLPKTIFEMEISYGHYEIKTYSIDDKGKRGKATTTQKIVLEKPIVLRTLTVPDYSASFVFDPNSLDAFTKDTDITLDFVNGMFKSTNIIVDDKTTEIVGNVASTVVNTAISVAVAGTTEKEVETKLLKEVVVKRQIDPNKLSFEKKENIYEALYDEIGDANALFGTSNLKNPIIELKIVSSEDWPSDKALGITQLKDSGKPLAGIPYRLGGAVEAQILLNKREAYSGFHTVKQLGGVAIIPLNAKAFSDVTQGLSFGNDGSELVKYTSKGTSSGEALSLTASQTSAAVKQGLIDREQSKLDMIKKQRENQLATAELGQGESLALIEAELAVINKKVELAEAQLKLAEAEAKLE
ncbi:hypothetical protein [Vibrio sp. Evd11]|uniref:hypothetical protein n=1 Tax=Vibrio sp. Evd11 TaxID=1207404 RepID=UPI000EFB0A96|nr:hypothetical protein [Vibrio sp. Evd11]